MNEVYPTTEALVGSLHLLGLNQACFKDINGTDSFVWAPHTTAIIHKVSSEIFFSDSQLHQVLFFAEVLTQIEKYGAFITAIVISTV